KLLLALGMQLEREGELAQALNVHAGNAYAGARARCIRVLEKLGQPEAALELACAAQAAPESECEAQQLARIVSRLRRALGQDFRPRRRPLDYEQLELTLPASQYVGGVERAVRDHLACPQAPVYYVENTLLNALFGLLCWDAIYAPLPGAFFHPFHAAPADLHQPGFRARRAAVFAACLARLDSDAYLDVIRTRFQSKNGIHTRFVAWSILDEDLLEQALACLPAAHLKAIFERMLDDISDNCAGLPDLIQFLPACKSYRMIEVKGPGDRLQDNQKRWLEFFASHGMPVTVCYVQWTQALP
nr:VRR-NUC domain-containing protein [Pseudomonas sp.]